MLDRNAEGTALDANWMIPVGFCDFGPLAASVSGGGEANLGALTSGIVTLMAPRGASGATTGTLIDGMDMALIPGPPPDPTPFTEVPDGDEPFAVDVLVLVLV